MSWKPQVQVQGEGDKWHDNALRFATYEEALYNVHNMSWSLITGRRAVESDDPVNYEIVSGLTVPVKKTEGADNA